MEQHGGKIGDHPVPLCGGVVAIAFPEPGPAIMHAHVYAKGHVSGNRQQSPGQSHGKAIGEDILDVLKGGEAQGDENGVDDGIEAVVEIGVVPGAALEEIILGPLLHRGDHQKGREDGMKIGAGSEEAVQNKLTDDLQHDGAQRRQHAPPQQAQQQPRRLPLYFIVTVNEDHEKYGGQHRRQNIQKRRKHRGDHKSVHAAPSFRRFLTIIAWMYAENKIKDSHACPQNMS